MNTRIEICTKEDESTTVKGGILERLVAQILTVQQFEVTKTVRVTGMEIDVYAKHKITNQVILVECKAHENALPADVITKLLGNIMLRMLVGSLRQGPCLRMQKAHELNGSKNQIAKEENCLFIHRTEF